MITLTLTKGLPASGKSTWAKEQKAKRVNKDDLRDMIDNGVWGKANEKAILEVRDLIIEHYLVNGSSVIVDDTNLHPKHEAHLRDLAEQCGAQFKVKSFLDVPLKTCIERDLKREKSVGERIIRGMQRQFLEPEAVVYTPPKNKRKAILCDIDGTLSHGINVTRKPYEWDKVGTDSLDPVVRNLVQDAHDRGYHVIIMSGRGSVCRQDTIKWLIQNKVHFDDLWMRPAGDSREDSIVKRELFDEYVRDEFDIQYVLDDRDRVVDMWRSMGLKVLQVAEGDF